jgi:hypothetical protein
VPNPPPAPAERFATLLYWLGQAVDTRGVAGRLAVPLVVLILNRISEIKQRFARLAARIGAGRYSPRRSTQPKHTGKKPRHPNQLPQGVAWLIKLVPEAAASASQLRLLFTDPEMVALLAAAPAPMARPLRSRCRMLGVDPPPILAPPPAARLRTPAPPALAGDARPPPRQADRTALAPFLASATRHRYQIRPEWSRCLRMFILLQYRNELDDGGAAQDAAAFMNW